MMAACPSCGVENPDRARFCLDCGEALPEQSAPSEVRKVVTVLFIDLAGSTAMGERLDPEATRRVMGRSFELARSAIEEHGGAVEKYVGDAVMAIFGIPQLHEDDAIRAVRAARSIATKLDSSTTSSSRLMGSACNFASASTPAR
jgi:class 3 adenylate cyclase